MGRADPPVGGAVTPETPALLAYRREGKVAWVDLAPAEDRREWMDQHTAQWAYRCLPLRIANQSGFQVVLRTPVTARWDGRDYRPGSVVVEEGAGAADCHFPGAILTFEVPFVLVTPPDVNLLVLPPLNTFVDGAHALSGMIETDWLHFTFTLNYKFTRPGRVHFPAGTPLATLLPYPRDWLGAFALDVQPMRAAPPDVQADYAAYAAARKAARAGADDKDPTETLMLWYYRGVNAQGELVPGHQKSVPRCPVTHAQPGSAAPEPEDGHPAQP